MEVPQSLIIELPYDLAIPLLGTYPKKIKALIWKDICTTMFTAALFTIVKQFNCSSTDEYKDKEVWFIYVMGYYSAIKNEILPFAKTWMYLDGIMLSKTSETEKRQYHLLSLICGI